jgi:hypothetical protein
MAVLENSPNRDGKFLLAGIALQRADFGSLAVQPPDALVVAAVDTYRADLSRLPSGVHVCQ